MRIPDPRDPRYWKEEKINYEISLHQSPVNKIEITLHVSKFQVKKYIDDLRRSETNVTK